MSRFTIKNVREMIETYNNRLKEDRVPFYFREQGRNGYQAVDLMSQSGACLHNVGSGTSKEVAAYVQSEYYEVCRRYIKRYNFSKTRDTNGNTRLYVKCNKTCQGFSIQTNGNLPSTHKILTQNHRLNATYVDTFIAEVNDYVSQHGTTRQKEIMQLI